MASIFDELTPGWLKDRFLVGVDLTLDDGTAYPEAVFTQAVAGAVRYIEHELGIVLDPVKVTSEKHDAFELNRSGFWPFRLDMRPVWTVTGFRIKYGSYEPLSIPLSWIHTVSPIHGQVNLIPSEESLGGYLYSSGMPLILGDAFQPLMYVPGYFEFDYTAGFATLNGTATFADGVVTATVPVSPQALMPNYDVELTLGSPNNGAAGPVVTERTRDNFTISLTTPPEGGSASVSWSLSAVPADLKQVIGLKAAALPLDIAGDLLVGAGIASTSVGADGLHMSVNTTSSATNCLHGDTKLLLSDGTTDTIKSLTEQHGRDGTVSVKCLDANGAETTGTATNFHVTGSSDKMYDILLSNNMRVVCTYNHPFRIAAFNAKDGTVVHNYYKHAEELQVGDELATVMTSNEGLHPDDPRRYTNIYVKKIDPAIPEDRVYDCTVATHHNFALDSGIVVHNSGYGARVLQFERELKALLPALRAKYKSVNMGVI